MPRINRVPKSRKDQGTCGRCGDALAKGCEYIWIKFRYGSKRKRCTKPECRFKGSELTQSEKIGQAREACEALDSFIGDWDGQDQSDVTSAIEECTGAIEEVSDAYQESIEALPEAFQETSSTAERCTEAIDELDSWKTDLEGISIEDFTYDADADDDEATQRDEWKSNIVDEVQGANSCPL